MDGHAVAASLFGDVVLTIIPSIELDQVHQDNMRQALEHSGGTFLQLEGADQHIADIYRLTHIISTHVDFPQYHACIEAGVQVVKPTWITHSLSKGRQAPARQYSPDPSQFFNDVIFTCGDLPAGDIRAITAGVMVLGGQYSAPLTKLVTHIVTTNMDNEKCAIVEEKGLSCKIVLPHWVDACLKLGKKISEKPYLLPNPEILQAEPGLAIRSGPTPHLEGAIMATPVSFSVMTPPVSPSKSRKLLNALKSKKVYFSDDLQISPHIHKTLEQLIESSGGALVEEADTADIYIGQYRSGPEYVAAARAGKEVANLSWLYHVINENRYTNPLSKMLHYPIPRNGIPGFENMKISISNYSGDARTYVENLVRYCGAEFTKTMKQDNTHLITAHMQSEKCEAAQEWNINIINHLWLEESYAKCTVQTLSNPKYSTFPARTNLGEVAGQTTLDMKSVERSFFPKPRSPQKPKSPGKHLKTLPMQNTVATVPQPTDDMEEDPQMPAADDDAESPAVEEPTSTAKSRGRPRKSAGTPRVTDDKENRSPLVVSAGRASKTKALNNLHEQAGDIALFQKEMKRKGGVVHGGRRGSDASPAPTGKASRKRTSEECEETGADEQLEEELQEATNKRVKQTKKMMKSKASTLPPIHTKMMVTGYERWKDDKHTESADRDKLRLLGVALTTDPTEVDILVAPRLLRTRKFVSALARAPLVVDTKYLDTALSKNKLMADPAMLHDREGEERAGFKLKDALQRAEENQGKLLRGWSIFVTKDVTGGFETYKEIVNVNGGDAYMYQGRTGMILPKRRLKDDPESGPESQNQGGEDEFDHVYLVSGSSDNETKDWKKFRDVARKQDLEARIVTTDWLLSAAMSQRVTFQEKWLL